MLDADPTASGPYAVERDDYNLGDEAVDLRDFNRKGEIRAAVFMPVGATGERPVVVFLHGRHTSCAGAIPQGAVARAWPCYPADPATGYAGQVDVESYLGYNDAATMLASQGYAVVSISANAINALDGSLADDTGAAARAQLVMDHLSLLRQANAGAAVGLSSLARPAASTSTTSASWATRAAARASCPPRCSTRRWPSRSASRRCCRWRRSTSRRMTVPGRPDAVILPYCDGDVSNQQGQNFIDDSRYAFDDDVLRSSVLVMGAEPQLLQHGLDPGQVPLRHQRRLVRQDRHQTDPTCGASAPTTRLNADEQYDAGNAYMTAWFRLTLGGEQQFLPMFDGSDAKPASAGRADVRVSATLPAPTVWTSPSSTRPTHSIQVTGAGTYATCESMSPLERSGDSALLRDETRIRAGAGLRLPEPAVRQRPGHLGAVDAVDALHLHRAGLDHRGRGSAARRRCRPTAADFSAHESLSFRVSPDDSVAVGGKHRAHGDVVDG